MGEAQALAVKDGKILSVGDANSVLQHRNASTEMIDLRGNTLMPGFVEPHIHVNLTASQNTSVWVGSLCAAQTKQDVIDKLSSAAQDLQAGEWLFASGFDPSRSDPLFGSLTLDDLNLAVPNNPVFVLNASTHIAYVNQAAFDAAGITSATPQPDGGEYVKDDQGKLTGQLNEPAAFRAFASLIPQPTPAELEQQFVQIQRDFSNAGITTAGDMTTGLSFGLDFEIGLLRKLAPTSPIRLRSYLPYLALGPGEKFPVQPMEGDDKLKFIGVKFTTDGSTQGFTAALKEPYLNAQSRGTLNFPSTPALINIVRPFFEDGWQLACHANGDLATEQVLELYRSLQAGQSDPVARRLRIEHFTVTDEQQIDAVQSLGVTPSMTIGHTFFWGQAFHHAILGPARGDRIDPAASLKARGVRFSFHSDAPVTPAYPLSYLKSAVTRVPQFNPPSVLPPGPDVLGPDQRISIDDALRAVTLDAAYQLFMDDKVGSISPGKYADFVVLDQNPRTIEPSRLAEIGIVDVYLEGLRQGPTASVDAFCE